MWLWYFHYIVFDPIDQYKPAELKSWIWELSFLSLDAHPASPKQM
jgi:hypothetical protein